jgi:hypothetical protein
MVNRGAVLGLAATLGVALGIVTFGGIWAIYPPIRGQGWVPITTVVASLMILTTIYALLVRIGARRPGDWFVAGYVLGLLTVAAIVMVQEILPRLRRLLLVA